MVGYVGIIWHVSTIPHSQAWMGYNWEFRTLWQDVPSLLCLGIFLILILLFSGFVLALSKPPELRQVDTPSHKMNQKMHQVFQRGY